MSTTANFIVGTFSTAVLAAGMQVPAQAQASPDAKLTETNLTETNLTETNLTETNSETPDFIATDTEVWQPSTDASGDGWTLPEATAEWTPAATQTAQKWGQPMTNTSALMEAAELNAAVTTELEGSALVPLSYEADALTHPVVPTVELTQRRRNISSASSSPNFVGVAADFGYFDDLYIGIISKLALNEKISVRPTLLFGDSRFAALVPVTYEFNKASTNIGSFQVRPYAGAGMAYTSFGDLNNNASTVDLLLSAGADVPLSDKLTLNAQVNYVGVFDDFDNLGVTVGLGYNLGNLFR